MNVFEISQVEQRGLSLTRRLRSAAEVPQRNSRNLYPGSMVCLRGKGGRDAILQYIQQQGRKGVGVGLPACWPRKSTHTHIRDSWPYQGAKKNVGITGCQSARSS